MTLLDQKASVINFDAVTSITPSSQYSPDPAKNGVGSLTITTPAGYVVDVVSQGVLQSGEIKFLPEYLPSLLVYRRENKSGSILVILNFSGKAVQLEQLPDKSESLRVLFGTHRKKGSTLMSSERPVISAYEVIVAMQ